MDKNTLLAIALCGILFVVYMGVIQKYYAPQEPVSEEAVSHEPSKPTEELVSETEIAPVSPPRIEEKSALGGLAEIELERDIVLENDELKTLWTNQGAALTSATLKRFKDPEGKKALELLKSEE